MHSSSLFTTLALASSALAGYEVKWDYSGANFFDNFEFVNVWPLLDAVAIQNDHMLTKHDSKPTALLPMALLNTLAKTRPLRWASLVS